MAKRKETEQNSVAEKLPNIIVSGPDEKQKFMERLTRAGYETLHENGVVMVMADGADYKKTVEGVHRFVKREGYSSSYGIAVKKG